MNNFWHDLPRPFFVLAPMEAVTDVVFRHVVAKAAAPDIWFTEFTNATGWVHAGNKAIGGRLIKTDDEHPIVAQLWGSDPEAMAKMAQHCADLGYDGIDINMGCPDKSAVKSGGGAGMILAPELAAQIIAAAKTAGLPVSVKTRLGYSSTSEMRDWASHILRQDVVNFTMHLRTKKEMSKVPAHFELIDELIALRDEIAPDTLFTINGDIENRTHGEQLVREHPGIDGIMIGRGIFHDPFCFEAAEPSRDVLAKEAVSEAEPNAMGDLKNPHKEYSNDDISSDGERKQKLLDLLRLQLDLYDEYSHLTGRPFETLKRFFKIYIRDFEGAAELRDKLMHTKSTDEVRAFLQ